MNRKPAALQEAKGAYQKDPQRRPKNAAEPRAGIGKAPEKMPTDFAAVWDEIVSNVCPGVLGNSDRLHMEMLTKMVCEFRESGGDYPVSRMNLLERMLGKLGLNPVDRMRITVAEKPETKPEDAYF